MTKTVLCAALIWAGAALGAVTSRLANVPLLPNGPLVAQSRLATPTTTDDEEDDAPVVKPKAAPAAPAGPAKPGDTAPATAPAATQAPADESAVPASAESMVLVSGAPLNNPNVGVHIVEKKTSTDTKRAELILYPLAMQVNGKFTQHFGSMASFVYHLQENFGLQITGGYNWSSAESTFNTELINKFQSQAQAATSLLWVWGVLAGIEVSPFYGKFAFFENALVHFSVVINGGAGLGGTRHSLKPQSDRADGSVSPATYGDTGVRFMGSLGAGFRVGIGDHFAIRLEVRDVVYTARVERVNGCDSTDLKDMDAALRMGRDPSTVNVSSACDVGTFTGTHEGTDVKRSGDVPLAYNLVKVPTSDVLNNIGLYLGVSFIF